MDVNSAYNTGIYGGGMYGGYGFMMPRYSQAYLNYINMDYKDRLNYDHAYNQAAREFNHVDPEAQNNMRRWLTVKQVIFQWLAGLTGSNYRW